MVEEEDRYVQRLVWELAIGGFASFLYPVSVLYPSGFSDSTGPNVDILPSKITRVR